MNSPSSVKSPIYRHVKIRESHSPVELKEKMRKDYRQKFKNSRHSLMNNLRGLVNEEEIRNTISKMYRDIFQFSEPNITDEEAQNLVEEIKKELIQEELKWCIEEYEKAQMDNFDWSSIDNEDVICPVCQKVNLSLNNGTVSCSYCTWDIRMDKSLSLIQQDIKNAIDNHSTSCGDLPQFTTITDSDTHLFLICSLCTELQFIV